MFILFKLFQGYARYQHSLVHFHLSSCVILCLISKTARVFTSWNNISHGTTLPMQQSHALLDWLFKLLQHSMAHAPIWSTQMHDTLISHWSLAGNFHNLSVSLILSTPRKSSVMLNNHSQITKTWPWCMASSCDRIMMRPTFRNPGLAKCMRQCPQEHLRRISTKNLRF